MSDGKQEVQTVKFVSGIASLFSYKPSGLSQDAEITLQTELLKHILDAKQDVFEKGSQLKLIVNDKTYHITLNYDCIKRLSTKKGEDQARYVLDWYDNTKMLGSGASSTAFALLMTAGLKNDAVYYHQKERVILKTKIIDPLKTRNQKLIIAQFKKERTCLKTLSIPVKHEVSGVKGTFFRTMPNLGVTLTDYLKSNTSLSMDNFTYIAIAITEKLAQLHSSGFVHLDIKPDNIFIKVLKDGSLNCSIADLDVSERIGNMVFSHAGTYQYMSPEMKKLLPENYKPEVQFDKQKKAHSLQSVMNPLIKAISTASSERGMLTYHPTMDMYSLGLVLKDIITTVKTVNNKAFKKIMNIIDGLINPSIKQRTDSCDKLLIQLRSPHDSIDSLLKSSSSFLSFGSNTPSIEGTFSFDKHKIPK
jgi:hypothetical protein